MSKWITKEKEGVYIVDADVAYPALLNELKASIADVPEPEGATEMPFIAELRTLDLDNLTQYWIEVVYQMAKLDVRRMLLLNDQSAWPDTIKIQGDKNKWGLKNFPEGRGINVATKGREAREHYRRLRNFIPN